MGRFYILGLMLVYASACLLSVHQNLDSHSQGSILQEATCPSGVSTKAPSSISGLGEHVFTGFPNN